MSDQSPPEDGYATLPEYWEYLERHVHFRSDRHRAEVKGSFVSGAAAVRDIVQRAAELSDEGAVGMIHAIDTALDRWSKEMAANLSKPEREPKTRAVDLADDRSDYFESDVLPLMRAVVDRAQEQGIGVLASFEVQRRDSSGMVKLASMLVPSGDGTVATSMATAFRELCGSKEAAEAVLAPPILH